MAKKKKKMTKAQAAAARRDDYTKKARTAAPVKDEGPKDKNSLFTIVVPLVSIAVIVLFSILFTVVPGMFIQ